MAPTNIAGILILLAAFAPGYVWIKVAETRTLRTQRSALLETIELALVGAVATLLATAFAGLADSWWGMGMADVGRWTSEGFEYFEQNAVRSLATVAAILGISLLGAWLGARFVYRHHPAMFGPERTVWTDVLSRSGSGGAGGENRKGAAFLAARLRDGRIFEGFLFSFPAGPTDEVSEIALQAPIFMRDSPSSPRLSLPDTQFLVLLLSDVTDLGVRFEEVPTPNV